MDLFDYLLAKQSGGGGGYPPPVAPKDSLLFYSENEIGISIHNATKNWGGTLYYSTDHNTWSVWDGTTEIASSKNKGWHKLFLRGVENTVISGGYSKGFLVRGSSIKCAGNCNNLLDYTAEPTLGISAFEELFNLCDNVSFSVTLPATTLAAYCYSNMFGGCTSLTNAPELPATALASGCYLSMFDGCTALATAPALPATALASGCYSNMFRGCTSLTNAPELPATALAQDCYSNMFEGCTALATAPALPATALASGCYQGMFLNCNSLATIPALPATVLGVQCYYNMFQLCRKIKLSQSQSGQFQNEYRIPTSGEGVDANRALYQMFSATGGSFTGTPTINTTYYTSNAIINP